MKQAKDLTAQPEEPQAPYYIQDWKQVNNHTDGLNFFKIFRGDDIMKLEWWKIQKYEYKMYMEVYTKTEHEALKLCRNLKNTL
jgi:hypothetical protein